jgi:hypothetical protein
MSNASTDGADHKSRFVWLLGTGAIPQPTGLSFEEFKSACEFALSCWQALPVIRPRLCAWAGQQYADSALISQISDLTISVQTLARAQMHLLRRFTQELERQQVPYVLLKGSASRLSVYASPDLRGGLDVDIGVPAKHIRRAERVVKSQGFLYGSLDDSRRHFYRISEHTRASVEENHYELACLVRRQTIRGLDPKVEAAIRRTISVLRPWHVTENNEVACYVTFDIHHGICLDIEVDPIVASAQRRHAKEYSAQTPSLEWAVFHLIFKLYWEGVHNYRKGAYQYADLVRLIPEVRGKAASTLIKLLSEYYLEAAGYYVLRRVESDFGMKLSPELQSFLSENAVPPNDQFPTDVNDLGDMWPKIWGFR